MKSIEIKKKVLVKKNGIVYQNEYLKKPYTETDKYYYYVYYSMIPNENGKYNVYTNTIHFEVNEIILEAESIDEAVKIANAINNSFRLFAGYNENTETVVNII